MDQWTGVHRAYIIRAYYRNNDSISTAQRLFKKQFSIYQIPPCNVIKSWLRHFECTGSSQAGGCSSRSSLPGTAVYLQLLNMVPWYRLHPKQWLPFISASEAGEFFKCTLLFVLSVALLRRLGCGLPAIAALQLKAPEP
ncbi:CG18367 [Drosophila busckii]|uniref:CG18367 n=1 Tax=Drosophila busckii TaxID=30019 RepID=A0A0M5J2M2_DROBS|nr:CG18367 [Drosophila busckii]